MAAVGERYTGEAVESLVKQFVRDPEVLEGLRRL